MEEDRETTIEGLNTQLSEFRVALQRAAEAIGEITIKYNELSTKVDDLDSLIHKIVLMNCQGI